MNVRHLLNSRAPAVLFAAILFVGGSALIQALGLDVPAAGLLTDPLGIGNTGLLLMWAIGHCDSMDGPVISLAKKALETRNVNLVLPWVRAQDEDEIRKTFDHALSVRQLAPQVRDLADRHFFETLVRVHRAGEGAPFTGLKPAGLDLGPAIPAADRALQDGSVDAVIRLIADAVERGIRERFRSAWNKRHFDPNDVAAGREYVEAYVPYIHLVERLYDTAEAPSHGHHHEPEQAVAHAH